MQAETKKFSLVIHGGAGVIRREDYPKERETGIREALAKILKNGHAMLETGKTAFEVVVEMVKQLEDCEYFNAGRGSCYTRTGNMEMEATLMDGKTMKCGAVTGLTTIKNPILVCEKILQNTYHVMLHGKPAEEFAVKHGCEKVDIKYFKTQKAWDSHVKGLEKLKKEEAEGTKNTTGTVGAVARDIYGDLAAASSTGGHTNKLDGRVGDSAIIGAGTYADNETCAVNYSGMGDPLIRAVGAYDISALMKYKGLSLKEATDYEVYTRLPKFGFSGGVIAVDREGNINIPISSEGMYRGFVKEDGKMTVKIFKDEDENESTTL